MPGIRTGRGLDRLVNFTDAAVAIAITLLVLPLVDLVTDGSPPSVRSLRGASVALALLLLALVLAVAFPGVGMFWLLLLLLSGPLTRLGRRRSTADGTT